MRSQTGGRRSVRFCDGGARPGNSDTKQLQFRVLRRNSIFFGYKIGKRGGGAVFRRTEGFAREQKCGRRAGSEAAEAGEGGAEDLLIGLRGAGDEDAGQIGGQPFAAELGGDRGKIPAGHIDDAGGAGEGGGREG